MKLSALHFFKPTVGWLNDLQDWLLGVLHSIWSAFVDFIKDMFLAGLEFALQTALWVLNAIPVPDWLTQYSLSTLLGGAGPTVGWLATRLRLSEALGIVAMGVSFRLVRKVLTLGRW